MIIIPAIDILGSKTVRLSMGDYEKKKEYELSPVEAALKWEKEGALRLHIVDLDGAKSGNPDNFGVIEEIIKSVHVPVEVGGGIRNNKTIDDYFNAGASYIVLGSILLKDIGKVLSSLVKYGGKIIAGLDLFEGKIAVSGWREITGTAFESASFNLNTRYGINTFIVTDIKKDGMLSGVNIDLIKNISGSGKMNIIASGGVSSIDDLALLKKLALPNLKGVIVGKALYDGRISLKDANAVLNEG